MIIRKHGTGLKIFIEVSGGFVGGPGDHPFYDKTNSKQL
jgi:hypothetical protein